MSFKNIAAFIAAALLIAYLAPILLKLKDVALTVVLLIGVIMMLVDLWQSLQSESD